LIAARVYLSNAMMDSNDTFTDAWLLFSIALAGGDGGTGLRAVIAAGDYVNHAIFTGDELRGGLSRLTARGWVTYDGGLFFLAGDARALSDSLRASQCSVSKALKEFKRLVCSAGDVSQPAGDYDWLTDDLLHQAYVEYTRNV
jgi:hypothetical protein